MPRLVFATWLFLSLDTYGLLDADYEATSTVALGFRCCARIARRLRGRYPVVVESERARRPPWASAGSGHYTVARGEAPRARDPRPPDPGRRPARTGPAGGPTSAALVEAMTSALAQDFAAV